MSSEKISALPSHTLNSADIIPVANGGANYGDTVGQIETAAAALVHWSTLLGDLAETQVIPFDGGTPGTADAGISRLGPASLAIGNGTAGDTSGILQCAEIILPFGTGASYPLLLTDSPVTGMLATVPPPAAAPYYYGYQNIEAGSWAAGVATYTTQGTNYYAVGDLIQVLTATPSGWNVLARSTAVTSNTFSVPMATSPGSNFSAENGYSQVIPELTVSARNPVVPALSVVGNPNSVPYSLDQSVPLFCVTGSDGHWADYSFVVLGDGHSVNQFVGGQLKGFFNGIVDYHTSEFILGWTSTTTSNPSTSANVDTSISRAADNTIQIGSTAGSPNASGSLSLTTILLAASASAPTSASTAGTIGQIIAYGGFLYYCSVTGAAGSATWNKLTMTAV